MKFGKSSTLMLAALLAAISTAAPAQETTPSNPLLTRRGWEVGGQVAKYHYEEPGLMNLKGNRGGAVGAYTFANANRVYNRIDVRASYGRLDYQSQGTGAISDVPDWIVEARAVIGRDYLRGASLALSPYIGLGYRYLYNDLRGYTSTNAAGYRRYSYYFYVPVGLTTRFRTGERWVVAPTVEYDAFLGGRQETKLSDAGVVQVDGFVGVLSDITNKQRDGRGYRASLMLEYGHWTFGPWLHYWKIKESEIQFSGGVPWVEPENWTREYGLELRYRF